MAARNPSSSMPTPVNSEPYLMVLSTLMHPHNKIHDDLADAGLTSQQRYYRRHKEFMNAKSKAWREKNRDRAAASSRRSYAKHADKRRAESRVASKRYRERMRGTPEQIERDRLRAERRRARKAQVPDTLTGAEWDTICRRFKQRCAYCGRLRKLTQDHVIPISKGGAHSADNVVPACRPCNSSKKDQAAPLGFR